MPASVVRDAEIFNHPIVMSHRAQRSVPAGDTDAGTLRCALRDRSLVMGQLNISASLISCGVP